MAGQSDRQRTHLPCSKQGDADIYDTLRRTV